MYNNIIDNYILLLGTTPPTDKHWNFFIISIVTLTAIIIDSKLDKQRRLKIDCIDLLYNVLLVT